MICVLFACNSKNTRNVPGNTPTSSAAASTNVGKELYMGNCMQCHAINADRTGPKLAGTFARWNNDTPPMLFVDVFEAGKHFMFPNRRKKFFYRINLFCKMNLPCHGISLSHPIITLFLNQLIFQNQFCPTCETAFPSGPRNDVFEMTADTHRKTVTVVAPSSLAIR